MKTDQLRVHDPNCKGCKRCAHFYQPFPHASFCQQVPCKCGATKRREEFEKELAPWFESLGITKEMRQEAEVNQGKSMTEIMIRAEFGLPPLDPTKKYVIAPVIEAVELLPTVGENSPIRPVTEEPNPITTIHRGETMEPVMNVAEVKRRIQEIADAEDNERQHLMEDALYKDVLQAIADGAANPLELAREVLEVKDLDFVRWYA